MTAVNWLDEQLQDKMYFVYGDTDGVRKVTIPLEDYMKFKQEALELEKEQIKDAYANAVMKENNSDYIGMHEQSSGEIYFAETYGSKGSDDHIVDTNEMVKRGTLKKRMDKDAWFVVFQSNAYNESDMAYELIKSQEIDIDMYDVYKDGDEVTFEVVNKKWAKITPFLYPFKTTSSQTEISDEEILKQGNYLFPNLGDIFRKDLWEMGAKWYREQLKSKQ